jgi:hypothetical protein
VVAAAGHAADRRRPLAVTILALASITMLTEEIAGRDTVATFRIVVICLAVSGADRAVTIIATRRVADALLAAAGRRRCCSAPRLGDDAAGAGVAALCSCLPPAPIASRWRQCRCWWR